MFRFVVGFICGLLAFNWVQTHAPSGLVSALKSITDAVTTHSSDLPNWGSLWQSVAPPSTTSTWVTLKAEDPNAQSAVPMAESMVQTDVQKIIQPIVSKLPPTHANLVLCSTQASYEEAMKNAHVQSKDIPLIAQETGGLAFGNTALIPLYQQETPADLTNSIAHELTHVLFNQIGIGGALPTWVNEGIAWTDGLAAQRNVDAQSTSRLESAIITTITQRAREHSLLSLGSNESQILRAKYNVEGEDYLAVKWLTQKYGARSLAIYLNDLKTMDADSAFQVVYHEPISTFNAQFDKAMAAEIPEQN